MSKKINRRRFLFQLGSTLPAFGLASCVTSPLTKLSDQKQKEDVQHGPRKPASSTKIYDCIVLGAGISGLALARELASPLNSDLKSKSVLVLEASDRIGGRMFTDRTHFKRQIERGAEFVHLHPMASVWRELYRYSLKIVEVPTTNSLMYHPSISSKAIGVVPAMLMWNPFKALGIWGSLKVTGQDMSAEEFLKEKTSKTDLVEQDFKRMILTGYLGAPTEKQSMQGFEADHIPELLNNFSEYYVRSGYDGLYRGVAQDLDIRLNQKVSRVTHGKDGVTIETLEGEVYRAKTACVTFSAGVLKSGQIEFSPALPKQKLAALDRLEMSFCSKVHIEFTERFWPKKMTMLQRPDAGRRLGKTYFVSFTDVPNAAPMLTALIMGEDGKKISTMEDEEILREICADISDCFPKVGNVYDLVKKKPDGTRSFLVTQWQKNPLTLGEASFINFNPNSTIPTEQVRSIYASPKETPALFWAGEGTAVYEQPASVHGALSTGLRASLEVHRFLDGDGYYSDQELAQAYHQSFGLTKRMKWFDGIERKPQDEDDNEGSWKLRLQKLITLKLG
jgi:monoamine oxidase